jgi:protein required for attachment to host cells
VHSGPIWFVVANSRSARFFLRPRWGEPLREIIDLADSADFLDKREPGLLALPLGYPQRAKSNADVQEEERIESAFLHRVASSIDDAMNRYAAESLVLCAPARELCLLRDYVSTRSRAKLSCEITADLVKAETSAIDAEMRHIKA